MRRAEEPEELEADWKLRRLACVAFITHHCRTYREAAASTAEHASV